MLCKLKLLTKHTNLAVMHFYVVQSGRPWSRALDRSLIVIQYWDHDKKHLVISIIAQLDRFHSSSVVLLASAYFKLQASLRDITMTEKTWLALSAEVAVAAQGLVLLHPSNHVQRTYTDLSTSVSVLKVTPLSLYLSLHSIRHRNQPGYCCCGHMDGSHLWRYRDH